MTHQDKPLDEKDMIERVAKAMQDADIRLYEERLPDLPAGAVREMAGDINQDYIVMARAAIEADSRSTTDIKPVVETIHNALESAADPSHRHKRGSEYVLIGFGKMQSGAWYELDEYGEIVDNGRTVGMREVAIYRDVDGELWVWSREDF